MSNRSLSRKSAFLAAILALAVALVAQKPQQKKKGDVDINVTVPPGASEKDAQEENEPAGKAVARPKDPFASATFNGLKLRAIGPALTSGRIVAFAVNPRNRAEYFAAAASGGVWKTKNDGTTWSPVFENETSFSIGTVVLDPHDSNIVWVGTGESNSQRSVSYGNGVYRSDDGGKSWKNLGLRHSEHIGRIVIDPRDSDVVYVAAEGPLWGPGGDRGLYKTTDRGKTWNKVLNIGENTGVADVALDPEEPDVIYAAAYQRRRHVWTLIDGGPEGGIHKSSDGGKTWVKLKSGLPTEDLGRIGLSVSPGNHNVIYATIEAADKKGGIFRSSDRGATWEKRNDYDATAMYYGQIVADPVNVDRIYVMNVFIKVSDDGGKTLRNLGEKFKHVDNHAMWIDPNDPNYYLVGCDGGVYESYDRGLNWAYKSNLPVTQFYDVATDNALPFYNVYGGTQDNNSLGGPSRTVSVHGIANADWFVTRGGDGFRSQIDPEDPNTVYSELQYGGLVRYDRRTGEETGIQPQEERGGAPYRWNWDSPLIISSHNHQRLYFAANKLFRSDDRGNSWRLISGDLTRQLDRNQLPVMGRIWGPDAIAKNASTSFYGNVVALFESPIDEKLIYLGTDDGLVQATGDGGETWRRIESFPGVPERTYVSRLAASHHDLNTLYAAFDNHKNSDFKPYLLKSVDQGKTWVSIAGDLPNNGPVLAFAEDLVNPGLLFVGTEFGLFFALDGRAPSPRWIQLKGNLPTIPVRDIVIHPREHDLVAATFGRGFYILDDVTPLRVLRREMLQQESVLFPVKAAVMFIETRRMGTTKKAYQGEAFYSADNPPYGAVFSYYLKNKYLSKKESRQEAEKASLKTNGHIVYPSNDELRNEALEEPPAAFLTISDSQGKAIRRISAPNQAGMNRASWDLRYPAPVLPEEKSEHPEDDEDSDNQRFGPLVMPGNYFVTLSKRVNQAWADLSSPTPFHVTTLLQRLPESQESPGSAELARFQQQVANLYRAVSGAVNSSTELSKRLVAIKQALRETPVAPLNLLQTADLLAARNTAISKKLHGDEILAARNENVPPSIENRVRDIMSNERFSLGEPTTTDKTNYQIAVADFSEELAKLRSLLKTDLPALEESMESFGAPWTPGRLPEWKEER